MLKIIIVLALSILSLSCDSPMNNRVLSDGYVKTQGFTKLRFNNFNLNIEVRWLQGPTGNINKDNHLMVIVSDEEGSSISIPSGLILSFYAVMPSMGHPMEDAGFFEEVENGIYINKSIRFNMSGLWINELWLLDGNYNKKDGLQWQNTF